MPIIFIRDPVVQQRARTLRNRATDAERQLWDRLKRKQVGGYRFWRQVPIAGFIADFACLEAALVIEVDGSQHQQAGAYDRRRDAPIAGRGFRVLRFWDNQVLLETESVLEEIMRALEESGPHPNLPPQAGEGV